MFYINKIEFFKLTREKKTSEWQQLRMEYVCLIYCEQNVSFCAIIFSNTYSILFFCENSSVLNGNYTEKSIFPVNSWQFYYSPFFYTSIACDACDKFHVCSGILSGMLQMSAKIGINFNTNRSFWQPGVSSIFKGLPKTKQDQMA